MTKKVVFLLSEESVALPFTFKCNSGESVFKSTLRMRFITSLWVKNGMDEKLFQLNSDKRDFIERESQKKS